MNSVNFDQQAKNRGDPAVDAGRTDPGDIIDERLQNFPPTIITRQKLPSTNN
jgi:hypothetical protein